MQVLTDAMRREAAKVLAERDPVLAPVIAKAGLCDMAAHTNYYEALVGEIIGQQLHVKAAASIRERFVQLFGGTFPQPAAILEKDIEQLRSVGLSRAKATYIRDLAQHVVDGRVQFDHLDSLSNEDIITELSAVKGIGEWTAHMFLMFCMGRPDVLAYGDLGVRSGIKKLYGLEELPTPKAVQELAKANHWDPFESVVCWYIWYSLDNKPTTA
jgi:DNA-3-methyladenine glycosylase II